MLKVRSTPQIDELDVFTEAVRFLARARRGGGQGLGARAHHSAAVDHKIVRKSHAKLWILRRRPGWTDQHRLPSAVRRGAPLEH
jgi:hypothetical protein